MKFVTRRLFFISLFTLSLLTRPAFALTFTHTVPFTSPDGPFVNISYGSSQSTGFSWLHDLSGIFPAGILSDAQLFVTYSRTNLEELWQVEEVGNFISSFNELSSVFSLPLSLLEDLQNDGILTLKLKELTSGADSFRLHQAVLSGQYTIPAPFKTASAPSVPEAGTFVMLAGIFAALRFKRSASSGESH